jgi:MYXO-CTERM domain-containing protein
MKKLYALLLIVLAPASAFAIPVQYTLAFGANDIDADGGTGSLYWDADAHSLSNLTWDFGAGRTGGVLDSMASWSHYALGTSGTQAEFVFEILTGENVFLPIACGTSSACGAGFGAPALFGWPGSSITFSLNNVGTRSYDVEVNGTLHHGSVSSAVATAVSEPSPWVLVTAGLGAVVLLRRRRLRADRG